MITIYKLLNDTTVNFFLKKTVNTYLNWIYIYLDNLAYKKPTWQTSEVTSSDNAVDGLYTNRTTAGNQCAVSKPDPIEVTWIVDLGVERSISEVRIYYQSHYDPWSEFFSFS